MRTRQGRRAGSGAGSRRGILSAAVPGKRPAPTLVAIALALLAGCGDDDEPGRTQTVDAAKPLTVVADEYSFDPETIVVTGAERGRAELRLTLKNDGALAHDLRVERDGDDVG